MKRFWVFFLWLLSQVLVTAHLADPVGMQVVQERDSANGVRVSYTRGLDLSGGLAGAGGIGGLLARTDAEGSTFYHHDDGGNVTGLMDAQGNMAARYLYGPFGKVLGQWGPMAEANRYQFSSKETEALSGLSYYGYRFYDPGLQRWINPDPLGEAGGVNLYGFVGNNPLSQIDPDGLLFRELFEQMGSGLVNLMMGPEPGRYNQMTQGAMIANELGGIDRNDNPLSGSIQEAVALLGDAATDQAAGFAGGKLLGAALGTVCKKLPKFPWQKVDPTAATDLNVAAKSGQNLLPQFTRSTIDDAVASAARARSSQISEGARAIAKKLGHAESGGYSSAFQGIAPTQANAESLIRNIMSDPSRTLYGDKVIDIYNAAGQGVRIEAGSGRFMGFLEGALATQ